jgi:hypothetical protein
VAIFFLQACVLGGAADHGGQGQEAGQAGLQYGEGAGGFGLSGRLGAGITQRDDDGGFNLLHP